MFRSLEKADPGRLGTEGLRRHASVSGRSLAAGALILAASFPAWAAPDAIDKALNAVGRPATAAEVKAWDIDVRADFQGLPPGKGDVALGEEVWEGKCASCHGVFGDSNEVFTPIVGGTTDEDIESGRVQTLAGGGHPHRTTLMKLSKLSTLWDYINRAMPWNAPKTLSTDEVYGVVAYILNLGDIVPADFTLSDKNMAQVQERLPNRDGKVRFDGLWQVGGKPDVSNQACMNDCPVGDDGKATVHELPEAARGTHGNIADQVRPFGPARGTSTEPMAPDVAAATAAAQAADGTGAGTAVAGGAAAGAGSGAAAAAPTRAPAASSGPSGADLAKASACTACHGMDQKIVGPGFREIAKKYQGKDNAVDYLTGKILKGGQGVWGPIPMPAQAQIKESDAQAIARWLADGAK